MTDCGQFQDERISAADGRYLGAFLEVYDPGPPADVRSGPARWPVGFSGNGFFDVRYFNGGIPTTDLTATGAQEVKVVNDVTGPTGLEDMPAADIRFTGSARSGMSFVGEAPGFATGWTITAGSCWRVTFWGKAVPDPAGFTCTGWAVDAVIADPNRAGQNLGAIWSTTGDWAASWTFYDGQIQFPAGGPIIFPYSDAQFIVGTSTDNAGTPKGEVHIKCLHVFPCSAVSGPFGIRKVGGVVNRAGSA